MRILILGAGGVGGYFGGRLLEAGADATFLVRPRRAAQLRQRGLVVTSPFGDIERPAATVLANQIQAPYDLVVLTCKAYDLAAAMDEIAPALGPASVVLPLLNGIAHLEALDFRFGRERVMGGTAHLAATLAPDGEVRHLNRLHRLTFGPRAEAHAARCRELAALLAEVPVDARLSEHILLDMWEKFVMLTTLAAVTCLMRASIGQIVATDDGREIVVETLDECRRVASASGFEPRPQFLEQTRALLTEAGSPFTASMLRDIERGGPVEADSIVGDMLRRARRLGVAAPHLRIAYCHLQAYQRRRDEEKAR